MSGWKHSSTKAILAGVLYLKSRFYSQNQVLYISIGSGTAFLKIADMISFKANFINTACIKKADINNKFHDYTVSFVELDRKSSEDLNTLKTIDKSWNDGQSFAWEIATNFKNYNMLDKKTTPTDFFALTAQRDNFDKLVWYDVLGLMQTHRENKETVKIDYLLTDPEFNYEHKHRPVKNIGTALLDSLKVLFPNKTLKVNALTSALDFYKANHFKEIVLSHTMTFKR